MPFGYRHLGGRVRIKGGDRQVNRTPRLVIALSKLDQLGGFRGHPVNPEVVGVYRVLVQVLSEADPDVRSLSAGLDIRDLGAVMSMVIFRASTSFVLPASSVAVILISNSSPSLTPKPPSAPLGLCPLRGLGEPHLVPVGRGQEAPSQVRGSLVVDREGYVVGQVFDAYARPGVGHRESLRRAWSCWSSGRRQG